MIDITTVETLYRSAQRPGRISLIVTQKRTVYTKWKMKKPYPFKQFPLIKVK